MSAPSSTPTSFLILGVTLQGRPFRPSDWADRLCSVMAPYKPGGGGFQGHLSYSPYVTPQHRGDVKCVRVDARIAQIEPLAYKFLLGFAQDNALQVEWLEA